MIEKRREKKRIKKKKQLFTRDTEVGCSRFWYRAHDQASSLNVHTLLGGTAPWDAKYCESIRFEREGKAISCEPVYKYGPFDGTDNVASTLSFCAPVKVAN